MSTNRRWYWAVIWHNPYTLPPDGYSRLMLVVEGERGYVSHRIKSVPDDLIPKPLYWLDRDWDWAWDITDRVHMLVWWPESLSLPWYE